MPISQGGAYLYRYLEQRLPNALMPRYRELPFEAGVIVPTQTDLDPGAYEVVKEVYNHFGEAKILADGAYDLPIVDINGTEDRYRAYLFAAAVSMGYQDERRAALANSSGMMNISVYDTKLNVATRAIQEKRNKFAAFGDSSLGQTGMVNNANVTLNNSSFDPFGAITPDDLADFIIAEVEALYTASNNVFFPNAIAMSASLNFRCVRLRVSGTEATVKSYVIKALEEQGVQLRWFTLKELESAQLEAAGVQAGSTNKDRIVLFPLDPEVIERHIEIIQLAPSEYIERRNMKTIYPLLGCATPTIINYPTAMRYIDVAKST